MLITMFYTELLNINFTLIFAFRVLLIVIIYP